MQYLVVDLYDEVEKLIELNIKERNIEGAILLSLDKKPVFYISQTEKGKILRFYQNLPEGTKLPEQAYYDEDQAKYFLLLDLKLKETPFGYLVIIFDLYKIKELYVNTSKLLIALFTGIFLLFLFLWYPIFSKVKKELEAITQFAKEIPFVKGNILSISPFFTEIRDLTTSLNWASLRLKETEKELIREKSLLEAIFSTIDEAILVVDLTFNIRYQNDLAREFLKKFGLEVKENAVARLFFEEILKTYPEERTITIEELLKEVCDLGRIELQVEANGSIYELSLKLTSNLEEEAQELLLSFKDITEKVKAQEEYLRTEKMRSLVQLAAGVAHDLNNVLAILFNKINLMLLSKKCSEEEIHTLKAMERHLKRGRYLAYQLLSLSKGGEIVFEKTDLEEVIKDTANFVLAGTKVSFHLDLKVVVKNLRTDPYALSQILLNLLINANQAGANTIKVGVDNVVEEGKESLLITVSDDGPGIPPDILNRIFEPFFTTKKEGSGLGLFIVKSLVKRLGGNLKVESKVGEGTTFYIYLPYETVEEEKVEEAKLLERRLRILVVDDEEDLRESLAQILEELGHEVITAGNGEEGLSTYLSLTSQGKNIDLLITDFTMPGRMNGLELIKTLREFDPNLKAILSSGYAEVGDAEDLGRANIVALLRKPYTLDELMNTLNKV